MADNDEVELKPNTIYSYVRGIQSAFSVYWCYDIHLLCGPTFNDPNTGLENVLDNKCRELQAKSIIAQGHNVLSDQDVLKLYDSQHLNVDHPHCIILHCDNAFCIGNYLVPWYARQIENDSGL